MKLTRRLAAVAAAGCLLLAGCGGGAGGDAGGDFDGSITVAIASAVTAPKEEVAIVAVGTKMGYFAEEGLTVDTINADGSVAAVQAVASGSADITPADTGSLLAAVQGNVPIKTVGGLVQNWPWQIATLPDSPIRTGADLKGKRLGVISLASGSAPYARAFIRAAGLEPDVDVELVPVGVGAQATAALTSGEVDALALYGQAYTVIELAGTALRYLENPPVFQGIRSLSFGVSQRALEDNREAFVRFLRAAYKSMLFSAANPRAAMQMGYEVFPQILGGADPASRIDADTKTLEKWLESATPLQGEPADWKNWGYISEEEWAKTQAYTKEAGQISAEIPLDRVWDPSLLEAANNFDPQLVLKQAAERQQ